MGKEGPRWLTFARRSPSLSRPNFLTSVSTTRPKSGFLKTTTPTQELTLQPTPSSTKLTSWDYVTSASSERALKCLSLFKYTNRKDELCKAFINPLLLQK